jgi:hypothetical protein
MHLPDVHKPFEAAYLAYLQALQEVSTNTELQQRATEAYATYARVLQESFTSDVQQRAAAAYANYTQVLQEAWSPAYQRYLQSMKDAWAEVDVATMDVGSMLAISQSMATVAWMAGSGGASATSIVTV